MAKILIALPAYNEEPYIGTMVLECKQYGKVVVFNDGSNDRTAEIAGVAGADVIGGDKNMGIGVAIQSLFDYAKQTDIDVLVTIDADFQHSPLDIPKIIQPILDGYDLVVGCRNKKQIPHYRIIGQKILSVFTHVISKGQVSDTQSGFRAYSPKAVRDIRITEKGMAEASEIVSVATAKNLRIIEVPISVKYTQDSSTFNPIVQGVDSLNRILFMISKRKPLLFFGVAGIVLSVLGFLIGVKGYDDLLKNKVLPIGTVLIATLFIIVGVLSIFTGIILNAVRKE